MNFDQLLEAVTIWSIPILFAITLHEAAHGWVANKLGDPTARMLGRITLNPIKHIDPIGTILVPLILLALGGFIFGWAKPVPVDARNFKKPVQHMAYVAAAGPASNLIMAFFWLFIIAIAVYGLGDTWIAKPLAMMGQAGIIINLVLMALNLLPIPPLDGGRVVAGLLPPATAMKYMRIEPYGLMILLVLLFTGILGKILGPVVQTFQTLFYSLLGL